VIPLTDFLHGSAERRGPTIAVVAEFGSWASKASQALSGPDHEI